MNTKKLHAGADFDALPMTNLDGDTIDISKPTGDADWQMVVVYRGRHCPLCTKFLNKLTEFRQRLSDIGIDVAAEQNIRLAKFAHGHVDDLGQLVCRHLAPFCPLGFGLEVQRDQQKVERVIGC